MRAGSNFRTAGAENVTSVSAPVSRRVALCAGFPAGVSRGVAVVTHEREIWLAGAIWAGTETAPVQHDIRVEMCAG